jgi:hypothetical protein
MWQSKLPYSQVVVPLYIPNNNNKSKKNTEKSLLPSPVETANKDVAVVVHGVVGVVSLQIPDNINKFKKNPLRMWGGVLLWTS